MDFRKAWSKALKAAGISETDTLNADGSIKLEKFTFHCLRHGFCSEPSDSGKEINQIAKLAGHKSNKPPCTTFIKAGNKNARSLMN